MKKENRFFSYFSLLFTFMKIGAFTFGGGYAMIPLIQKDVVEKKKWIREGELLDILAISESTPGPIAVNAATFVGYKVAGIWGALFATFGLALPSFVIIFLLSLIYDKALQIPAIMAMFKGIRVAVICLLISAIIKIKKAVPTNLVSIIIFSLCLIGLLLLGLFNITIPCISLAFIGFGLLSGIVLTLLTRRREKE
mgnify:CR=1 FL=1